MLKKSRKDKILVCFLFELSENFIHPAEISFY